VTNQSSARHFKQTTTGLLTPGIDGGMVVFTRKFANIFSHPLLKLGGGGNDKVIKIFVITTRIPMILALTKKPLARFGR
jgi:hypothetical protein